MYGTQKAKGLFSILKYQKFLAPISKWDVLFKNDQILWIIKKPNEKIQRYVIILLWEVIYVHFYNWDTLLDLVPVLYDWIELIIEVSLWTKDYSTFDTHTQHTRLLFNECLFHLCNCTCSSVMCIVNCLSIPKKIFEYLYVLEGVFMLSCFEFLFKLHFSCFSSKTSSEGGLRQKHKIQTETFATVSLLFHE